MSKAIEDDYDAPVGFVDDNHRLATRDGTPIGESLTGAAQRVVHPATGHVAFYLADPSTSATNAAARHLLRNWRHLAKQHRSGPFWQALQAPAMTT